MLGHKWVARGLAYSQHSIKIDVGFGVKAFRLWVFLRIGVHIVQQNNSFTKRIQTKISIILR